MPFEFRAMSQNKFDHDRFVTQWFHFEVGGKTNNRVARTSGDFVLKWRFFRQSGYFQELDVVDILVFANRTFANCTFVERLLPNRHLPINTIAVGNKQNQTFSD